MINLNEKKENIEIIATKLFEKFTGTSGNIRLDQKERTGIQVLVWQVNTKNFVMVPVKKPSVATQFFAIEKAVRAEVESDYTSQDSADLELMKYAGSISIPMNEVPGFEKLDDDVLLTASTSGLKAEEDVAISIAVLAEITGLFFREICELVLFYSRRQSLPDWYFKKDKSYFSFLFE